MAAGPKALPRSPGGLLDPWWRGACPGLPAEIAQLTGLQTLYLSDAGIDGDDRHVYVVGGVVFTVIVERIQYYERDGKLITESLMDYTRRTVQEEFSTLDEFLKRWQSADRKQAIIDELLERGVLLQAMEDAAGGDLDPFDLICHVAFDQPPLTRQERADNVPKRDVFTKYGDQAREVLAALLDKYADQGLESLGEIEVLSWTRSLNLAPRSSWSVGLGARSSTSLPCGRSTPPSTNPPDPEP